jgi:hypothetical protein
VCRENVFAKNTFIVKASTAKVAGTGDFLQMQGADVHVGRLVAAEGLLAINARISRRRNDNEIIF